MKEQHKVSELKGQKTENNIKCVECQQDVDKWNDISEEALENGVIIHKECPEKTTTDSNVTTIRPSELDCYEYEAELGSDTINLLFYGEDGKTVEVEFVTDQEFEAFIQRLTDSIIDRMKRDKYEVGDSEYPYRTVFINDSKVLEEDN